VRLRLAAARIVTVLLLAGLAGLNPIAAGASQSGLTVGQGAEQATIARDAYGVPNIHAQQTPGVWFGAGYAQAEDRLVQLELVRRTVEGTLSEIFGPSQLDQDEGIRLFFYTPAEVQSEYDALPATFRGQLQAYADGINAFVADAYASPQSELALVPYEYFVLGQVLGLNGPYRPAPWQPTDTVAVGNFLARDFGGGGGAELDNLSFMLYLNAELSKQGDPTAQADACAIFNDARWINDLTAPTTVPGGTVDRRGDAFRTCQAVRLLASDVQAGAKVLSNYKARVKRAGQWLKVPWRDGSNAFVVAPSRSADGHALLWGAPQEGFGTPSIDGEEYLHGPSYDAGGMYITGEPFVLIGRNNQFAWTTTSEELVDQQIYLEQVNFSTSPPTYFFNGQWLPMTMIQETIPVAGQAPVEFTIFRTGHGPVFFADPTHGIAFSMRFASWLRESGSLQGFGELGGDRDLAAFTTSVSKITTLHNLFYADRVGNIAYFGAGLLPILPTCAACDPRLPHPGDGSQEWLGFEAFSQMPHAVNPAQGFLANWNTKPDQGHFYQQNGWDEYWGTIFRSQRIAEMIQAKPKLDLNDVLAVEQDVGTIDGDDTMRPAAPYFIPFLEQAYANLLAARDPLVDATTHPDLAPAVAALGGWDEHTSLGSPAMSIFVESMEALWRNLFGGGLSPGEQYVGAVDFNDAAVTGDTFLRDATYNLQYHALAETKALVPCAGLCFSGDYFNSNRDRILVESLNDAVGLLSGTGPLLGNGGAHGFGTPDIGSWGWAPWHDIDWDSLDPLAVGVTAGCGTSPSQERSTYMQAIDLGTLITGVNVLPPGQSGFISVTGTPSPHLCDQVGLFNAFQYKTMDFDFGG
jgi:penicillin G amidase